MHVIACDILHSMSIGDKFKKLLNELSQLNLCIIFSSCLSAQDPLCGWSAVENKCIGWNKGFAYFHTLFWKLKKPWIFFDIPSFCQISFCCKTMIDLSTL